MASQAHKFAFYFPQLSNFRKDNCTIKFDDENLIHRLFGVVRKRAGQEIILFDDRNHVNCVIIDCNKRFATLELSNIQLNVPVKPSIIVCMGLTKKPAFEEIVYGCSALGVHAILPLLSRQVERDWLHEKELPRLERISIAAREQAKSFCRTELFMPIELSQLASRVLELTQENAPRIVFEASTKGFYDLAAELCIQKPEQMALLFGPEGGFLNEEIAQVQSDGFIAASLTPTILRSEEAVLVGTGALLSLLTSKK